MAERRASEWLGPFFSQISLHRREDRCSRSGNSNSIPSEPPFAQSTRRPFVFKTSLRAEWSQNNLPFIGDIRSHSNPGNRFFLSLSLFISTYLFCFSPPSVPSFLPAADSFRRASVFRGAIIFAAWCPLTRSNSQ